MHGDMSRTASTRMQPAHPLPARVVLCCALLATPVHAADVNNGKQLYQTYCQACHGITGQGDMPGTPNFTRGQGLLKPDLALLNVINEGRNAMPAFQGILDHYETLDVIAYLRTFF